MFCMRVLDKDFKDMRIIKVVKQESDMEYKERDQDSNIQLCCHILDSYSDTHNNGSILHTTEKHIMSHQAV